MKNIKNKKFVIFLVLLIFLISIFSVTCFADSFNGVFKSGDTFVFASELNSSFLPSNIPMNFECDGTAYNNIYITYRGYMVIEYQYLNSGTGNVDYYVTVYNDSWTDDVYRTIYIKQNIVLEGSALAFFSINRSDIVDSYYNEIYSIIIDSVYGDTELSSDMTLSASLISTILSLLCILAPVLICVFVFVLILKRC